MAQAARKAKIEKIVILDPETGELTDLPGDVLPNKADLHRQLVEEAERKAHWLGRARDYTMQGMSEAVPPSYTRYIGEQLMRVIR